MSIYNVKILCPYCKQNFEASDIPDYQINDIMDHAQKCPAQQKSKKKQE